MGSIRSTRSHDGNERRQFQHGGKAWPRLKGEMQESFVWESTRNHFQYQVRRPLGCTQILSGKKATLGKTSKTQTEAKKLSGTRTRRRRRPSCMRGFSRDFSEVEQKYDKEFERNCRAALENAKHAQMLVHIASQQVHDRRMDYHTLSRNFESRRRRRVHCSVRRTTGTTTS